jgi:hypothetical protein
MLAAMLSLVLALAAPALAQEIQQPCPEGTSGPGVTADPETGQVSGSCTSPLMLDRDPRHVSCEQLFGDTVHGQGVTLDPRTGTLSGQCQFPTGG